VKFNDDAMHLKPACDWWWLNERGVEGVREM
jgi:hypothetical protein